MIQYEKIHVLQGIDVNKSNNSKECNICHYWYFIHKNFKYDSCLCNGCSDMMMKAVSFKDVAIIYIKGNAARINFYFMSKNDAINLLNNSNLNNKGVLL